jgi:hypothetical protein
MTQTPKILAALLAQLPDNTTGDISAEDIRDVVVSLYPSRGQLQLASGGSAATTFASSGTYVKVAGTTELDTDVCSTCVTMPSNGVLELEKDVAQVVLVNATLEVLPAGNNKRYTFTFAKNGTAIPGLAFTAFYGNLSGNPAGVFLSGLVPMVGNDELSVVVKNDSDTTSITASVYTVSLVGFIK